MNSAWHSRAVTRCDEVDARILVPAQRVENGGEQKIG